MKGEFDLDANQNMMPMWQMGAASGDRMYTLPLAMAYVPRQRWGQIYEPHVALHRGTIFPELDLPFLAAGGDNV
jgi:hypothetical protein